MQQQWHSGFELPTSEHRRVIGISNSNFSLHYDRSGIDACIHEMDGYSRVSKSGLKRFPSGTKTGKHREQTEMQVEYSAVEGIDNLL